MKKQSTKCYEGNPDCFALNEYGSCMVLSDTKFKDHDCPFYKTEQQLLEENPVYYQFYGKRMKRNERLADSPLFREA